MNVLLIHPRLSRSRSVFRYALSFLRKALITPSTDLLRVGIRLPSQWRTRLLDLNVTRLSRTRLAWGDCAIIHAHRSQRVSAWMAALRCRARGLRVIGSGSAFRRWHSRLGLVSIFCQRPLSADWRHLCQQPLRAARRATQPGDQATDPRNTRTPLDVRDYESVAIHWPSGASWSRLSARKLFRELDELESIAPDDWHGTVHLLPSAPSASSPEWNTQTTDALRAWRKSHRNVAFRVEIPLSALSDRATISRLVDAGVKEAFVRIKAEDLASPSLDAGGRARLTQWIKRAQRMGLQIIGGLPTLQRSGDWLEAVWMASRIRALRLTRVLTCMLHAPLGRLHLFPALRSLFASGLSWRRAMRIVGIGVRSLLTAPRVFGLALTLAVFSEHYGTACGSNA